MGGALVRYRAMAYIVGTLLIALVLVGVPLKYAASEGTQAQDAGEWITTYLGVAHGWLYMVFLVTAVLLARRAGWDIAFTIQTMLLGTIPVASFWGERRATARTRATSERTDSAPH